MFQPDTLRHLLEEAKPEASPYTLESLEAWLVTMPAREVYCYVNPGGCLIGRYLKERCGFPGSSVGGDYYRTHLDGVKIPLPDGWQYIAQGHPSIPRTFGAALTRTRAAIAARTRP